MKDNNQLSADDIFELLSKQYNLEDETEDEGKKESKQTFKVTKKTAPAPAEEPTLAEKIEEAFDKADAEETAPAEEDGEPLFVSPVPKSADEDSDIDSLLKKYLSEDDYKIASRNITDNKDLFKTLDSIDTDMASLDQEEKTADVFEAPDRELFASLSENGKVCDIPEEDDTAEEGLTIAAEPKPAEVTAEKQEEAAEETKNENEEETISIYDLGNFIAKNDGDSDDGDDIFDAMPIIPLNIVPEKKEEPVKEEDTAPVPAEEVLAEAFGVSSPEEKAESTNETMIVPVPEESEGQADEEETEIRSATDTDTNIMLAFGMDEELDSTLGKDEADKLRDANEKDADAMTGEDEKTEEKKPRTHKELFEAYKKAFAFNAISVFGTAVVAIILFFYENIPAFGGHLADIVNPDFYPTVNIMFDLQILFIGFICVLPYFIDGCRSLAAKKPTVNSMLPILFTVSVLYAALSCMFAAGTVFKAYFFPASLVLAAVAVSRRLDLKRERTALSVVSSKRVKYALEKLDIEGSELESRAFNDYLPDSPEIFKINKANQIEGFEERSRAYPSIKLYLYPLGGASIAALIIGLVIGLITGKNWETAVITGYTAFSFCLPSSLFLAFSLPAFLGEKNAAGRGSAFVGEASTDEYTSAASISFDDRDVFPTSGVKLFSVKMFGEEERIDYVIYYAASVYQKIGGPFSDVLNVATADIGRSNNTEIISLDNNGVEALVDGIHIFLGKADYIRKKGFTPKTDESDIGFEGTDIAITYLVCNEEVYAKLYIRYSIDPDFEDIVKTLYQSGICVGIKTVDPNIDDEMLSSGIKLEKYPVRVLKYSSLESKSTLEDSIDSGVVSKRNAKSLLKTFTLCEKIKHVTKTLLTITSVALVIGVIITAVAAFMSGVSGIYSVYVALFQLVWIIPSYLLARLFFN